LPPDGLFTEFFKKRYNYEWAQGNDWNEVYEKHASFTAEYGKIISVSIGRLTTTPKNPQPLFYVKTITNKDEKFVLQQLGESLTGAASLCGHNIIDFDCPIAMRRYLANGMVIPPILDSMNKKPWDLPYLDTMKMWQGSAYNHKISQKQLAHILGVPSSKDELDGSKIAELYFSDAPDAQEKICDYNGSDVVCNARNFARMKGHKEIKDIDVFHIKILKPKEPEK